MARAAPQTFAKRQREQDKKRKQAEKRDRRADRKANPLGETEAPPQICRPIEDPPA